jgi:hypothetical protein
MGSLGPEEKAAEKALPPAGRLRFLIDREGINLYSFRYPRGPCIRDHADAEPLQTNTPGVRRQKRAVGKYLSDPFSIPLSAGWLLVSGILLAASRGYADKQGSFQQPSLRRHYATRLLYSVDHPVFR